MKKLAIALVLAAISATAMAYPSSGRFKCNPYQKPGYSHCT